MTPRETAAAFGRAASFIGHDSGPMHLAAAVGLRCTAVFSARNIPRVWFPYGDHHRVIYHRTSCAGCGLDRCLSFGKNVSSRLRSTRFIRRPLKRLRLLSIPGPGITTQVHSYKVLKYPIRTISVRAWRRWWQMGPRATRSSSFKRCFGHTGFKCVRSTLRAEVQKGKAAGHSDGSKAWNDRR